MGRNIAIIQGHPDANHGHLGDALVQAYEDSASEAGHEVRILTVAELDFPLIASQEDWQHGEPNADIRRAQSVIDEADHLLIIYPLWLGTMPALLKGFFEQVFRPGFAISDTLEGAKTWRRLLTGKSARIVVTMGMPALAYRWYFRAHSLKSLERNILAFCGIKPIRETLIGLVASDIPHHNEKSVARLRRLGSKGA